jgi:hypothetical protein
MKDDKTLNKTQLLDDLRDLDWLRGE